MSDIFRYTDEMSGASLKSIYPDVKFVRLFESMEENNPNNKYIYQEGIIDFDLFSGDDSYYYTNVSIDDDAIVKKTGHNGISCTKYQESERKCIILNEYFKKNFLNMVCKKYSQYIWCREKLIKMIEESSDYSEDQKSAMYNAALYIKNTPDRFRNEQLYLKSISSYPPEILRVPKNNITQELYDVFFVEIQKSDFNKNNTLIPIKYTTFEDLCCILIQVEPSNIYMIPEDDITSEIINLYFSKTKMLSGIPKKYITKELILDLSKKFVASDINIHIDISDIKFIDELIRCNNEYKYIIKSNIPNEHKFRTRFKIIDVCE